MSNSTDENPGIGQQYFAAAILLLLIVLGSIERIYGIDRQSLWSDELYAVMASYMPSFSDAWRLMLGDSHPPGYLTFMYFTLPLTSYTDFGIRLHALIFGIAWIPLVYWLGKRWFSLSTGLLAAAVITSAYNAVYYSQEARAYTMLVTFTLINMICLFEMLLAGSKQRRHAVGFVVSSVAMLYLHYSGFVFIAAEILLYGILWVTRQSRCSLREGLILFGIPLLLYSPWLEVMYLNMVDAPRDWSVSKAPTAAEIYNTLQRLLGPDRDSFKFHMIFLGAAVLSAVFQHARHGLSRKLLATYCLFFLAVVPVLAFLVESLVATPLFEKRYFLSAIVIEAILVASVTGQILQRVFTKWESIATAIVVVILSALLIKNNIDKTLYSILDKDPIREAVNVVKTDLGDNIGAKNYTVLMTHDWFEHYLRTSDISFDREWEFRRYYVSQRSEKVDAYLSAHQELDYFYYLTLREPNAISALVPLKQQYKLLSKNEVSIEQGAIDIFKFSTKEKPDEQQLSEVGSNPSNEIAKLVAQDAARKDPATYRVLFTHDWVLPYLRRNGVTADRELSIGSYVVNAQADDISRYVQNHPEVDTLYYLALQEPNAEGAIFMLQSRYLLASEQAVQTAVGKMNVLTFNVKAAPLDAPSLHTRRGASRANELAMLLAKDIQDVPAASYAVVMSHGWLEPYIKQNGVYVDEQWDGRFYNGINQEEKLFSYLTEHPGIKRLYYVALVESTLPPLVDALKSEMALECEQSIDAAAGRVSYMRFDVKRLGSSAATVLPDCGN